MRNIVMGSVAALLLTTAIIFYVARHRGADLPTEFTSEVVCLACRQPGQVKFGASSIEPYMCPKCGQRAAYSWRFCTTCKSRFVPQLQKSADGSPPRMPAIPTCIKCGSSTVGAWLAENPDQKPVGDAPLPKWPP